jgi:hypothetical protein
MPESPPVMSHGGPRGGPCRGSSSRRGRARVSCGPARRLVLMLQGGSTRGTGRRGRRTRTDRGSSRAAGATDERSPVDGSVAREHGARGIRRIRDVPQRHPTTRSSSRCRRAPRGSSSARSATVSQARRVPTAS